MSVHSNMSVKSTNCLHLILHPIYADFSFFFHLLYVPVHVSSPSRRDSASALSANTVLSSVLRRCCPCILSALGTSPSVSSSSSNVSSRYNPLRVRTLLLSSAQHNIYPVLKPFGEFCNYQSVLRAPLLLNQDNNK